jgi:hypothetical protein
MKKNTPTTQTGKIKILVKTRSCVLTTSSPDCHDHQLFHDDRLLTVMINY